MQHPVVLGSKRSVIGPRDIVVFMIVIAIFALMRANYTAMNLPIAEGASVPISLEWQSLPGYALRTIVRMLIAVVCSVIFTVIYAILAAKCARLEKILIPLLDILQSVPILGYLSFTVTGFIALFPGSTMGLEMAAIFAIFTSQVWNMTFSLYQSLKNLPCDLQDASKVMGLSAIDKFFKLELPFAMPGLIWNTMMSMSGGWFFVVASEAITVGQTQYTLPGIGSYISVAIAQKSLPAVLYAVIAMTIVIIIYDQLLFRPLVAWADKFRYDDVTHGKPPKSWVLDFVRQTNILKFVFRPIRLFLRLVIFLSYKYSHALNIKVLPAKVQTYLVDIMWYSLLASACVYGAMQVYEYMKQSVTLAEFLLVFELSLYTGIRVIVLITLASLFWVPIGVYIGLRPRLTEFVQPLIQFLAAFPVNLLFPIAVIGIMHYELNPNIWLSPLMIMGTQWYILFNVIAGVSTFPNDLKEAATTFKIKGWLWWRKVMLPAVFPYLITGALTASGGAWNASIVAEIVSWGDAKLVAKGVGSYITQATNDGNFDKIALGIAMLSFFVIVINRVIWRPLYKISEEKIRY
jgi:NitT/TauT family transport system permease protein